MFYVVWLHVLETVVWFRGCVLYDVLGFHRHVLKHVLAYFEHVFENVQNKRENFIWFMERNYKD